MIEPSYNAAIQSEMSQDLKKLADMVRSHNSTSIEAKEFAREVLKKYFKDDVCPF